MGAAIRAEKERNASMTADGAPYRDQELDTNVVKKRAVKAEKDKAKRDDGNGVKKQGTGIADKTKRRTADDIDGVPLVNAPAVDDLDLFTEEAVGQTATKLF